jgi:hypothetical protein
VSIPGPCIPCHADAVFVEGSGSEAKDLQLLPEW